MSSASDELEFHLGGVLTPGLASLSDVDLDALASAITAAKLRRKSAPAEAIDHGPSVVPTILRGPVRAALFG